VAKRRSFKRERGCMGEDLVRQKCVVLCYRHAGMMEGIRDLMQTMFESVIMVAGEASLLDAVKMLRPDLVLVDLSFPVSGGTGVAAFLRQHAPGVKFIVLGTEDAPEVIDACMAAGASGYLLTWNVGKDLIKAVKAVQSGLTYVPYQRAG
jgi:two-component system nitrate/nitrite response regulator NarL